MNPAELLERHTGHRTQHIEQVRTAAAHNVWRCDDAFFVKIGTRDNFAKEAQALELAASLGIPVPEAVAVGDTFLISRAVRGVTIDDGALDRQTRRTALTHAGAYLRSLHTIGAPGFGIPDGSTLAGPRTTWIEHVRSVLEWAGPALKDLVDLDVVWRAFERDRELIADVETGSVLHGDFSVWHVLVDPPTGDVTAIIDWADAQVGDPLWDIACFVSWRPRLIGPLIAGYEPSDRLRERIDALLPFYRAYRHIWGYRAGLEDGWDESVRIPFIEELIDELHRAE